MFTDQPAVQSNLRQKSLSLDKLLASHSPSLDFFLSHPIAELAHSLSASLNKLPKVGSEALTLQIENLISSTKFLKEKSDQCAKAIKDLSEPRPPNLAREIEFMRTTLKSVSELSAVHLPLVLKGVNDTNRALTNYTKTCSESNFTEVHEITIIMSALIKMVDMFALSIDEGLNFVGQKLQQSETREFGENRDQKVS